MTNSKSVRVRELESVLRAGEAGTFIDAVQHSRETNAAYLVMTLQAFEGEPDLLYTALEYANSCGQSVLIAAGATAAADPQ